MKINFKTLRRILSTTFRRWSEDEAPKKAASLAYYTVLSLAPLVVIAVSVAGFIFGEDAARGEIVGQIGSLIGEKGAEVIQTLLQNSNDTKSGVVASLIGIATLVFGASGVFIELQDSLNEIWRVPHSKESGIKSFIKHRLISFAMVLGIGFLLTVSLLLSAFISGFTKYVGHILPMTEVLLHMANVILPFFLVMGLFAMIFKFLPDVRLQWRNVWVGSAITALLFTIGKTLIGLYLGRATVSSVYGAAGSVIAILVWVYYAAHILFFGAEFTFVYTVVKTGHEEKLTESPQTPKRQGLTPSLA